jgi:hypothetical protein
MRIPRIMSSLTVAAVVVTTACASTAARQQPQPQPQLPQQQPRPQQPQAQPGSTAALLEPPEPARRAAANLTPTGLELGTMWTFENAPAEYWREQYGFTATKEWLDNVRLASVRYGESCSASFVSPTGLVMTNHHCARECVEAVSTDQVDYVERGFYARTRTEEKLCPELFLDQLLAIEDVTQRVRAAAPQGATSEQVAEAQLQAQEQIENECKQRTRSECQVVPLYQGGQYQLYTYKRYTPVKLVFAPELQAGFFGGDPDNFTYPRYALDVSFVRAYNADGNTPAATPNYFRWRAEGAAENELVFVTGNPGSTSRLITVAQLMYERALRHPFIVTLLEGQRRALLSIGEQGAEQERQVREELFSVENSLKAYAGQLAGLRDTLLVARKIAWEREFRQRVSSSAEARGFADVWDRIADIQRQKLELNAVVNISNAALVGAPHLATAGQLAGLLRAAGLPEAERAPNYRGERFTQLRAALLRPTPIPEAQALPMLELQIGLAQDYLPPGHPLLQVLARPGETPQAAARRLARESRVLDVAFRKALIEGARGVADTVTDPLFRAARVMDSIYNVEQPRYRAILAEETVQRARLASALFAVYGTRLPPDATFTLRISDGVVARYPYNGTVAPPKTTFHGLYARAAEFDNRMPWQLPPTFERRRASVNMIAPLNFVSTNDITGGNSGSPMIDREARIVGIAFDGNIEQLPNEFLFRTEAGRTISVHSAGILEALRSVYEAQALVTELLGGR